MEHLAIRLTELGRIRLGALVPIKTGKNVGKPRPEKLTLFRFSSNNKPLLHEVAKLYGGEVVPWEVPPEWKQLVQEPPHAFQLFSTSDTIKIIVPSGAAISTKREVWAASGCEHRCDAETRIISIDANEDLIGQICDREDCDEVSRVSVFLQQVPGFGVWRMDTKGFYASAEIRGFLKFLKTCQITVNIHASMRLEQRTTRRYKQTSFKYVVPVITPDYSPDQLLALAEQSRPAIPLLPVSQQEFETTVGDLYGQKPDEVIDQACPVDSTHEMQALRFGNAVEFRCKQCSSLKPMPKDQIHGGEPPIDIPRAGATSASAGEVKVEPAQQPPTDEKPKSSAVTREDVISLPPPADDPIELEKPIDEDAPIEYEEEEPDPSKPPFACPANASHELKWIHVDDEELLLCVVCGVEINKIPVSGDSVPGAISPATEFIPKPSDWSPVISDVAFEDWKKEIIAVVRKEKIQGRLLQEWAFSNYGDTDSWEKIPEIGRMKILDYCRENPAWIKKTINEFSKHKALADQGNLSF